MPQPVANPCARNFAILHHPLHVPTTLAILLTIVHNCPCCHMCSCSMPAFLVLCAPFVFLLLSSFSVSHSIVSQLNALCLCSTGKVEEMNVNLQRKHRKKSIKENKVTVVTSNYDNPHPKHSRERGKHTMQHTTTRTA